ncbi:MAG: redox-regulated ATPase YchF, partial [Halanaerobiales bacterium]
MQVGIVGLPNVGKSTLFNALTSDNVGAENYPFCTIDPNIGVVEVPDRRLQKLNEMYQPEKLTPTTIEFVDIAGLVKGASQGEGLGNQFLAHIREVDAIAHVIRCFKGSDVAHVSGEINPLEDIKVLNTELMLADLATLEKRKNKTEKMLKTGEDKYKEEMEVLKRLIKKLNKEINVRELKLNNFEKKVVNELNLLTAKPVIYIANVGEEQLKGRNKYLEKVKKYTTKKGIPCIAVSAKLEEEIAGLPSE